MNRLLRELGEIMTKNLQRFFQNDAAGGIFLIVAAVLAMLLANMGATSAGYEASRHAR
jgi:NhaA family Na+:H+ antiporter